jgi:hypothetical protein
MGRLQWTAPVVVLAMVAAACGSTVQPARQVAIGSSPGTSQTVDAGLSLADDGGSAAAQVVAPAPSGDAFVPVGTPGATSGRVAPAAPVSGGSAPAPSASSGAPRAAPPGTAPPGRPAVAAGSAPDSPSPSAGAPAPQQPARQPAPAQVGPGVSDDGVVIGITYVEGGEEYYAALGFAGVELGSQRDQAQFVVDYINDHGGVAGRPLIPEYHGFKAGDSAETSREAACAHFTEDRPVLGVAVFSGVGTALVECLADVGSSYFASGNSPVDDVFHEQYRQFLYAPSIVSITRSGQLMGTAFTQSRFLTGEAKIGVIYPDAPVFVRGAEQGLKPALAEQGLEVAEEFAYTQGDAATIASQMQSAVLRFRTTGITHVLFFVLGGATFFMIAAENQGYRPQYGLNTNVNPWGTSLLVPRNQIANAVSVGWQPAQDLGYSRREEPVSATEVLCEQIMRERGVNMDSDTTAFLALFVCDTLLFAKHALDRAPQLTARGIASGIDGAGQTYASPLTWGTDLGAHRDGARLYRSSKWDAACGCFAYTSGLRPIP